MGQDVMKSGVSADRHADELSSTAAMRNVTACLAFVEARAEMTDESYQLGNLRGQIARCIEAVGREDGCFRG